MTDLIDRYVHQVGRYLPQKDRAEIETELRSQIHDQLEDRFGGAPAPSDIAAVLAEMGDPRRMAVSYHGEQYLVGPNLYPFMLMVLRTGWLIVPTIVVFLNIFGALISAQPADWIGLVIASVFGVLQALLIFSAVVVLIFAILERSGIEMQVKQVVFDPLTLPALDDPGAVDRVESATGVAIGTFVTLALLYFLQVGGLTLRFDLSNPGEVIPVPTFWLILMIGVGVMLIALNLWALRRNRWSALTFGLETILEVVGAVCLYFILFTPLVGRIGEAVPNLRDIPGFAQLPAAITIITVVIMLAVNGYKFVRLLREQGRPTSARTITAGR